jgi:hypothetical protein
MSSNSQVDAEMDTEEQVLTLRIASQNSDLLEDCDPEDTIHQHENAEKRKKIAITVVMEVLK